MFGRSFEWFQSKSQHENEKVRISHTEKAKNVDYLFSLPNAAKFTKLNAIKECMRMLTATNTPPLNTASNSRFSNYMRKQGAPYLRHIIRYVVQLYDTEKQKLREEAIKSKKITAYA